MQNITVSDLLNRLESLNFCTYAEQKNTMKHWEQVTYPKN